MRAGRFALLTLVLLSIVGHCYAACSGPSAQAGRMIYAGNLNLMVYCDGTNWVSMAGGVSQTINTTGGGATPAGSTADVQYNSGGALAADTGVFTYASSVLKAPTVSATTVSSTYGYHQYISGTQGSFGSLYAGPISATIISVTAIQVVSQSTSPVTCNSGNGGTLRYNSPTTSLELCTGAGWQTMGVGIPAGTISAFASTTCPTGWSEYTTARGRFLRGIDNSAGIDPSGTRAPGNTQGDLFKSHTHGISNGGAGVNGLASSIGSGSDDSNYAFADAAYASGAIFSANATGGAETRPVNVAVTFCQFNGTSNGWNYALGGATPAGSTADVQYNSGGSLAADTGNFTYASSVLKAPTVSATTISATFDYSKYVSSTQGTFGSIGSGLVNATGISITTNQTSVTTLYASGNVGIGTATPLVRLNVVGSAPSTLARFTDGTYGTLDIGTLSTGSGGVNLLTGAAYLAFSTDAPLEAMRILRNGLVMIGTTSQIGAGHMSITYDSNNTTGAAIKRTNASPNGGSPLEFYNSSAVLMGNISENGSNVAYNTSSDRRLKENIAESARGLAKLSQIKVEDFNFIADPSKTRVQGFIAQDVYKVYPEAVTVGGPDAKRHPWSVDYGRLTPLLVKSIQELKADNDNYRAAIESLRQEFETYKRAHP